MSCRFSRRLGSNGHMTDPFLKCHRDLDLYLCVISGWWIWFFFWSKARWNEWKGFGYIDVQLLKWTLSLMVAGERTCPWNSQLPLWLDCENRPWKSQNHGSVENGSFQYDRFLSFRVIFHWTMIYHDYGRKGRSRSVASLANCFGRSFCLNKSETNSTYVCLASSKKGCHIFRTVDSPMSKKDVCFWKQVGWIKNPQRF